MPEGAVVSVERDGPVCRVRLDRPERLNALGETVRTALHEVVRSLADDAVTRILVLSGSGRAFSAGADLRDRAEPPAGQHARRVAGGRWQRLLDDLEALPQVTVAALHGHVIGGAVLLACACDLRVAARRTRFAIPEVALGLPLTWAGLPRLVREVGLPRARDLVMTARVIDSDEALNWGLVTRVVSDDALQAAVDALVAELVAMPPGPLGATRAALAAMGRPALAVSWADPDLLGWALVDPETREAFEAYRRHRLGSSDDA